MVTLLNVLILVRKCEQLRSVGPVEDEMEIVKQHDRTLKSELALLRSKLANCETELLLCKNKIRSVNSVLFVLRGKHINV